MGNVAASGGYWVATPGDFIFAEPSTITGSIGVFGVLPSFEGTLPSSASARTASRPRRCRASPTCSTARRRQADALIRPASNDLSPVPRLIVAQSRKQVARSRSTDRAGPRVGRRTARQLGLVDGFGGMDEAIAKAAGWPSSTKTTGLTYLDRQPGFADELMATFVGEEEEQEGPPMPRHSGPGAGRAACASGGPGSGRSYRARRPGALPRLPPGRRASTDHAKDRGWVAPLLSWSLTPCHCR